MNKKSTLNKPNTSLVTLLGPVRMTDIFLCGINVIFPWLIKIGISFLIQSNCNSTCNNNASVTMGGEPLGQMSSF